MAVAVEGERDAAAPDDLLQQQEVAARVLDGAEEGVHGCAGRIVNGEQEGEARAARLEPGVMAAVDLEQHPLAGGCDSLKRERQANWCLGRRWKSSAAKEQAIPCRSASRARVTARWPVKRR